MVRGARRASPPFLFFLPNFKITPLFYPPPPPKIIALPTKYAQIFEINKMVVFTTNIFALVLTPKAMCCFDTGILSRKGSRSLHLPISCFGIPSPQVPKSEFPHYILRVGLYITHFDQVVLKRHSNFLTIQFLLLIAQTNR